MGAKTSHQLDVRQIADGCKARVALGVHDAQRRRYRSGRSGRTARSSRCFTSSTRRSRWPRREARTRRRADAVSGNECSAPAPAEVLHPVDPVAAAVRARGAHRDGRAVEDVGAVARAAHPGVHHGGHGRLARGDVLRPRDRVARRRDPVDERAAVPAGVAEVVVGRHVLRVARGGGGQAGVERDGLAARLRPLGVDEREDLARDARRGRAGRGRRRRGARGSRRRGPRAGGGRARHGGDRAGAPSSCGRPGTAAAWAVDCRAARSKSLQAVRPPSATAASAAALRAWRAERTVGPRARRLRARHPDRCPDGGSGARGVALCRKCPANVRAAHAVGQCSARAAVGG